MAVLKSAVLNPYKEYGRLSLPKGAEILLHSKDDHGKVCVHYQSRDSEMSKKVENAGFGYCYYCFREGKDVSVKLDHETEKRKVVYSGIVQEKDEAILFMVVYWEKK